MAKYTLFTQFASILLLMTQNALFKFCVNFILNFLRYVFFSSFDALYRFFKWFFYSIHGVRLFSLWLPGALNSDFPRKSECFYTIVCLILYDYICHKFCY